MATDTKKKTSKREGKRLMTCWLDNEEYALLQSKAKDAGMSSADWVRHRCIESAPKRRRKGPDVVSLHRLIGQVSSVGSLTNQLARKTNATGAVPQLSQLREIRESLEEITAQVAIALGYDTEGK